MIEPAATTNDPKAGMRALLGRGLTPFSQLAKVLANRHKISIIYELARGEKRFMELERALAPITAKVLTRSLRDLESVSLVVRETFDVLPPKVVYRLSVSGEELVPIIRELCKWTLTHAEELMPSPSVTKPGALRLVVSGTPESLAVGGRSTSR